VNSAIRPEICSTNPYRSLEREHGIPEIETADTDFLQFGFLKVSNPLR
jgi:hypothetical protein